LNTPYNKREHGNPSELPRFRLNQQSYLWVNVSPNRAERRHLGTDSDADPFFPGSKLTRRIKRSHAS